MSGGLDININIGGFWDGFFGIWGDSDAPDYDSSSPDGGDGGADGEDSGSSSSSALDTFLNVIGSLLEIIVKILSGLLDVILKVIDFLADYLLKFLEIIIDRLLALVDLEVFDLVSSTFGWLPDELREIITLSLFAFCVCAVVMKVINR